MSQSSIENREIVARSPSNPLIPVAVLWGTVLAALSVFLWTQMEVGAGSQYYLIPWSIAAGVVILAVPAYILLNRGFDLFHPLVFGVWSYIFPAFILGGIILSFGLSDPYFLAFVENPEFNLPYSLFIVVFGYVGMVAGFYLPFNRKIVDRFERVMPDLDWDPNKLWGPGIALIIIGTGFNILGFFQGLLGFQRIDQTGLFDGLVFYLTIAFLIGNLLLWLAVFQARMKTGLYYIVIVFLTLLIPLKMALQGNRGSLLSSLIPIAMAFWYSGRRVKWQHTIIFGVAVFLALGIGILYGTTFRLIKGSEARINAGDYVGQVFETVDYISRTDTLKLLDQSSRTLFVRVENLSSLAVVVANYEKLEAYEESYGLKINIYHDIVTAFIPRFVWPDKPVTSDARAYSDLYFNYSENSFAITPFGDLIRNFGLIGVPLGMLIVGVYLRVIYSVLIETPQPRIWKKMAYFPLLTVISYEAFYATMFPGLVRTLVVLFICITVVAFLAPVQRRSLSGGSPLIQN